MLILTMSHPHHIRLPYRIFLLQAFHYLFQYIDRDIIIKAAKETGAIVTAEEHSVIGGLGAAVCEALSETCPVPVKRVGVQDTFGRSGKVPELLEMYGLTAQNIAENARQAIALKK